ncbi:DUF2628 domain-containing protein [Mycobacterium sp. SM1]|uniref:DUF2628 domain-containing protein n=1 Tax=Mycobacterium sp. SM1 TaxID=2816243 RepID=UPI001BD0506D|nr:DUF2628 domain-containing protein [Mycobacterium sp. SM1]
MPSSSPEARQAFKALPFGARVRINSNIPAFLFGPLYFFAKGMWRKGVTLLAPVIAAAIVMVAVQVPDSIGRAVGVGLAFALMTPANYGYYLHVVRRSRS